MDVNTVSVTNADNYLTQTHLADETQRVFARSVCGVDVSNWQEVSAAYKTDWEAAHQTEPLDDLTIK